jgi:hypothetical protein
MMLKKMPSVAAHGARQRLHAVLHPVSARARLRRRLYLVSAPVLVGLLAAAIKMISVGIVGNSAATDFAHHDMEALRHDVSMLNILDVVDPVKILFAGGDLYVLEGRLHDADDRFSQSLSRTGEAQSCPVRINLLLVRETLGDLATQAGNKGDAVRLYTTAIALADAAPQGCFAGNADSNEDRRAIREHAIARLQQKLALLQQPPPLPPPPAATATSQPPPTSLTTLTSAPPIPGLPPSSTPPSPGPGPAPSTEPVPGPGPNMPQLPGGTTQGPVFGPASGDDHPPEGSGPLNPVSPDRIPIGGGGGGPVGHRLGGGDPLDKLRTLLDNSNAYGDNQE